MSATYSTPAFTACDAWNMDVTLCRYLACGLNAYLNDAIKCRQISNDDALTIRSHIVHLAEFATDDGASWNEVMIGRVTEAFAWTAANWKGLWT